MQHPLQGLPPPPRGGALRFLFDGGVPQPTMKWGSKELTTMVKYRVFTANPLCKGV